MSRSEDYDRQRLYEEVWAEPVTVVAKRYGVSDVALHKACKCLNVPVPPRGYWMKIRAGRKVTREPLPPDTGTRARRRRPPAPRPAVEPDDPQPPPLHFLPDEERAHVLAVCAELRVDEESEPSHPRIVADKAARVAEARWYKQRSKIPYWSRDYPHEVPKEIRADRLAIPIAKSHENDRPISLNVTAPSHAT